MNNRPLLIISREADAARKFAEMAYRVTGRKLPVVPDAPDHEADLILIGSDAVNPVVHQLLMSGRIESLNIRYGTDDFRILSLEDASRRILILAGGRVRATLYAVYEYFEKYCGCRYFWDGDIIPRTPELPMADIDRRKTFRFQYRGLRYFAHRSLHRFQAEHWDWEDWKREIDYLVKRKFNLFMLRTGFDDLFQKAFPDCVDYPSEDERSPEAIDRSFNDRTTFWSLRYRGELRRKILQYARRCDLMHPEDIGTITHWYSRTPLDFLAAKKPALMHDPGYHEDSGRVWDITDDEMLENYYRLTQAHIRHYGAPDIFHTIGLAERNFGSREHNIKLKLYTYHRFIQRLRRDYPHAPLLIATWDFLGWGWNSSDVQKLLAELDPANTILLDYTTDSRNPGNDFSQWGMMHRFPWIFGTFQAYESFSDLNFDFGGAERRYRLIEDDPMCQGMVIWSENSHSNSLLLEWLAERSSSGDFSLRGFCDSRYGKQSESMSKLWEMLMPQLAVNSWLWDKEQHVRRRWKNNFNLLRDAVHIQEFSPETICLECRRRIKEIQVMPEFLEIATAGAAGPMDAFVTRDLIDLVRTYLTNLISREISLIQLELWNWRTGRRGGEPIGFDKLEYLVRALRDLLALHEDYSLYESLLRLARKRPVNPYSEATLKSNAENFYCRSYIYELFDTVYLPEIEVYRNWINDRIRLDEKSRRESKEDFAKVQDKIRDVFYNTPLEKLRPSVSTENLPALLQRLNREEWPGKTVR